MRTVTIRLKIVQLCVSPFDTACDRPVIIAKVSRGGTMHLRQGRQFFMRIEGPKCEGRRPMAEARGGSWFQPRAWERFLGRGSQSSRNWIWCILAEKNVASGKWLTSIDWLIWCYHQWLNYSKVGGGTLNSGVDVELIPVVKFSRNGGKPARGAGTAFRPVPAEFNHYNSHNN